MIFSIVVAAIVLGLLILVHEAGHFVIAKQLGVRVIRFSIGYPPKIWGKRRGETEYAIGATPFGGYVRMLGDEVGDEPGGEDTLGYLKEIELDLLDAFKGRKGSLRQAQQQGDVLLVPAADRFVAARSAAEAEATALADFGRPLAVEEAMLLEEIHGTRGAASAAQSLAERRSPKLLARFCKRAFPSQSLGKRFAIVLAGPLANILFAPVVLAIVFMYGVPYLLPIVGGVQPGMPAATAGIKVGDRVVSINGNPVTDWAELSQAVKRSKGAPLKLEVERPAKPGLQHLVFNLAATQEESEPRYGVKVPIWAIGVLPSGQQEVKRVGPIGAVYHAGIESVHILNTLFSGIAQIINGTTPVREALGGPIMIAQMAGHEAHQGFVSIAMFVVMLTLELGIINLMPVPMLDGGHLLFFGFEGIRGKPLKLRHREIALQLGLLLLVALMAFVIFNDISRIVKS